MVEGRREVERALAAGFTLDQLYFCPDIIQQEEIKSLKEQLSNQANELTELKTLKKNIEKLKFENEELSNANKELKNNLEKEKQNKLTKKDSLTDIERQDSSAK